MSHGYGPNIIKEGEDPIFPNLFLILMIRLTLFLFLSFFSFFFFCLLPFLGPLLWHMEVPRLGGESEL